MAAPEVVFPAQVTGRTQQAVRDLLRGATVVLVLALLGYCITVAWRVLADLGTVRLIDARQALEVLTVRDAILCFVGWRLAKELLRAVAARRTTR